jgi:hypothetical protein
MKTFLLLVLFAFLTGCASTGKAPIPADGPDTPNHYDPVHGWKF